MHCLSKNGFQHCSWGYTKTGFTTFTRSEDAHVINALCACAVYVHARASDRDRDRYRAILSRHDMFVYIIIL